LLPLRPGPKVLHWQTGHDLDYAVGQISVPVGEGQVPARFRRHVFFVDHVYWVVWDELTGVPGNRTIWENFHFATRDLACANDGRTVMTSCAEGANLLMLVGQPGWTMQKESTRMWPVGSRDTVPMATLHYEAHGATAARGFGALFVPLNGREAPPQTSFDGVERLTDGRVRWQVSVAGQQRTLTTRSFEAER